MPWGILEQRHLRSRHPNLTAARAKSFEQCRATTWVEMGGDFVQQQDWPCPAAIGDEIGMRKRDAKQQRLLFACGAALGGLVLVGVAYR